MSDEPESLTGHALPQAPDAVFDPAALAKLQELDPGGRRGFLLQVFRTYEGSLVKHLDRMAPGPGGTFDAALVAEVAHTLKSSSAAVGAMAFAARCSGLEKAVKSGQIGDIVPAVHAMRAEGQRVLQAVRAMLAT